MDTDNHDIRRHFEPGEIARDPKLESKRDIDILLERHPLERRLSGIFRAVRSFAGLQDAHIAPAIAVQNAPYNRFHAVFDRLAGVSAHDPKRTAEAPYGFFGGRPLLGESTPINGRIYLSVRPCEALVLDEKHGGLERIYHELLSLLSMRARKNTVNERDILVEITTLTEKRLRFSFSDVERILTDEEVSEDYKIALDLFISEGSGIARHQVLLASYLMEKMRSRGLLKGHHCIDSTSKLHSGNDERLLYTSPDGYLFVFDPLKINAGRKAAGSIPDQQ